jgi:hypothetical protein
METKSNMINSDELERSLGFLIHDIARMMRLDFERRVRLSGLTRAQWFVLARGGVWDDGGREIGHGLSEFSFNQEIAR